MDPLSDVLSLLKPRSAGISMLPVASSPLPAIMPASFWRAAATVHIRKESDQATLRWSLERMMQELRERLACQVQPGVQVSTPPDFRRTRSHSHPNLDSPDTPATMEINQQRSVRHLNIVAKRHAD
jgi:hypothetical protein